jgi:putrescine importer
MTFRTGIGSGVGSQLGAARLLYGMGRSNALPPAFFAAVEPKRRIPRNNVILVGLVAVCGAFLISYGLGAEILNFGALLAYMGVNAAALARYYLRGPERRFPDLWPPVAGFCRLSALVAQPEPPRESGGASWMIVGLKVGAVRREDSAKTYFPSV